MSLGSSQDLLINLEMHALFDSHDRWNLCNTLPYMTVLWKARAQPRTTTIERRGTSTENAIAPRKVCSPCALSDSPAWVWLQKYME